MENILKFKAYFNGIEINDGDYFRPDKISDRNHSTDYDSYKCIICSHGILWTNKITTREDWVEVRRPESKITKTYYSDWESLHLLSKDVVIEVIL
jgi:hypothetical protein